MEELVPEPPVGRRFRGGRRVRLGDADAHGRLRLDALARLLQDLGTDDFADAGVDPRTPWVVRRSVVDVAVWPRLGERLALTTWCGGLGGRWGERRTSVTGDRGAAVEVATLSVHLGTAGRPSPVPGWFLDIYAEAALGRRVSARLSHPPPPAGAPARPWPLRSSDLDVLGHVNNAATWVAVEDEAARHDLVPRRAELEYREAIEPDDEVVLRGVADGEAGRCLWLTVGGQIRASALVAG